MVHAFFGFVSTTGQVAIDEAKQTVVEVKLKKQSSLVTYVVHYTGGVVFTLDVRHEIYLAYVHKNNQKHFPHFFVAYLDEIFAKIGSQLVYLHFLLIHGALLNTPYDQAILLRIGE